MTQHANLAQLIKKTTDSKAFDDMWFAERSMLEGGKYIIIYLCSTLCIYINVGTLLEELEELIGLQEPLLKVLRLFCLQSLTSGGIKAKAFDLLRRELIQTYGGFLLYIKIRMQTSWKSHIPFPVFSRLKLKIEHCDWLSLSLTTCVLPCVKS